MTKCLIFVNQKPHYNFPEKQTGYPAWGINKLEARQPSEKGAAAAGRGTSTYCFTLLVIPRQKGGMNRASRVRCRGYGNRRGVLICSAITRISACVLAVLRLWRVVHSRLRCNVSSTHAHNLVLRTPASLSQFRSPRWEDNLMPMWEALCTPITSLSAVRLRRLALGIAPAVSKISSTWKGGKGLITSSHKAL